MALKGLTARAAARTLRAPGITAFVVFLGLISLWSAITPLYGAPDEPAHVIRAASVVRGQLLGNEKRGTASLQVSVPAFLAASGRDDCFAFFAAVPASCMHLGGNYHGDRQLLTSAGRHPPAYYAIVGLPSLLARSNLGVWLMRFLSAALCAALIALAVSTARRYLQGTLATLGIVVAVTPMVFFLAGVVNPSGLEISAAVAAWVAAFAVASRPDDRIDPRLVDRLGIASAVLIVCRQLGLLWLAIIGVSMLLIAGTGLARRVWRQRRARAWLAALAVIAVAQVSWLLSVGSLNTDKTNTAGIHLSLLDRFRDSFGVTYSRFLEMIGTFGWRDTLSPTATIFFWSLALGALVAGLYLLGRHRALLVLALLAVAVVAVPPLFEAPAASHVGYFWQGRYTLPLAVGIPLLAGALIRPGTTWRLRRAGIAVSVTLGIGFLLAFLEAWRRNAVGTHGNIFFLSNPSWTPPVPAWIILPAVALLTGMWMWLLLIGPTPGRVDESATRRPEDADRGASAPADQSEPVAVRG